MLTTLPGQVHISDTWMGKNPCVWLASNQVFHEFLWAEFIFSSVVTCVLHFTEDLTFSDFFLLGSILSSLDYVNTTTPKVIIIPENGRPRRVFIAQQQICEIARLNQKDIYWTLTRTSKQHKDPGSQPGSGVCSEWIHGTMMGPHRELWAPGAADFVLIGQENLLSRV